MFIASVLSSSWLINLDAPMAVRKPLFEGFSTTN
jgi:hypothetical protein